MKNTFFARNALRILMIVFFLTPFALRGARLAVQGIKNDVKDWLPSDFQETAELDWFREHFLGEQFVAVSWEGCEGTADDEIFKTFVDKFFPEIPPSLQNKRDYFAELISDEANDTELSSLELPPELYPRWQTNVVRSDFVSPVTGLYARQLHPSDLPPEEEFVGNQYGLFHPEDDHHDWAEQDEKWLMGFEDKWYFITPDGKLYEWSGGNSILQPIFSLLDKFQNKHDIPGTLVKDLGPVDGPWYYANPERLNARLFKSVVTGPGILSNLTAAGGSLEGDIETAKKRLSGYLFGPNGKQTCVVVTLTEAAKADLRRTLGRGMLGKPRGVLVTLAEESGISGPAKPSLIPPFIDRFLPDKPVPDPPVIKMGGPSVDNVAIDEEGQITLVRLVGLSVLVGLGLSWLSFRSVKVTIMVFFVGGLSAVTSVSLIYWSHSSIDAVMMSMPSLVYVLGLSGAVHIVNYYRETVEEQGMKGATERAIKLGWKPCTLAAFTTALGLISLYSSEIFPIKRFGL
ncbi:MAG: hypothetical protein KDA87_03450, partial [Planctomycetales bacterium]|nr:hypothetical protein [Planctomycetales bacterium]